MRLVGQVLLATVLACGGSDATSTKPGNTGGTSSGTGNPPVIGFSKRSHTEAGIAFPYQVFAPTNYSASTKWPVIVALAGTAERGNDNLKQLTVGMGPLVTAQPNFPAVVVFPQLPSDGTATDVFFTAAPKLIAEVVADYNGDPSRTYITGLSYGGTVGFALAYNNPSLFAAFLAISPGMCTSCIPGASSLDQANQMVAQKLKNLPVWVHQGDKDLATAVAANRQLDQDFRADGSTTWKYTEYPGEGHVIWDEVYAQSAVWSWLFAQSR